MRSSSPSGCTRRRASDSFMPNAPAGSNVFSLPRTRSMTSCTLRPKAELTASPLFSRRPNEHTIGPMETSKEHADLVIAGGGLAGLSLAIALRQGLGPSATIVVADPGLARAPADDA